MRRDRKLSTTLMLLAATTLAGVAVASAQVSPLAESWWWRRW